jgi:hypothetical protein
MSEPWHYEYPSPLEGYQGLEPLPEYVPPSSRP